MNTCNRGVDEARGPTKRARPPTNYINYIQNITGHQPSELTELSQYREDLASTRGRVCRPTATRL